MTKKRILFVDDDREMIELVKVMRKSHLREWDICFASDGPQALGLMANQHFDAIVSDIEMPTMTGVELLSQVMSNQPQVIRILQSAQTDKKVSCQSIGPSHQYLRKPWRASDLNEVLSRAFALHDLIGSREIKTLVSKLPSLPTLPASYFELTQEVEKEEPSLTTIGEIVSRDIGMTAMILKLVNSAYFGLRLNVSDPVYAAKLLGLDTIMGLVLHYQVFSQFSNIDDTFFSLEQLMHHSLGVGSLAKMITRIEEQDKEVVTDAMIGGILHDTGKLILAQSFPSEYRNVIIEARERNLALSAVEKHAFSASHAEVGAYLLGIWRLPHSIVEAVAFHHEPDRCNFGGMHALTAVYAANVIEQEGRQSDVGPGPELDEDYLAKIKVADKVQLWRNRWMQHVRNQDSSV